MVDSLRGLIMLVVLGQVKTASYSAFVPAAHRRRTMLAPDGCMPLSILGPQCLFALHARRISGS